jgi:DNA-binding IclR family transcriptional regulator
MEALEMLAFQPLSAPQVAAAMGVHPRTARRLLNRLREEGYVSRSDDARRVYSPTLRIVSLAGQVAARHRLVQRAAAFVAQLAERTGAAAQLCIPSYDAVLSVLCALPGRGAPEPALGQVLPCHCTAPGKVLLAWRHTWRDSVLRTPLRSYTARTVTDPEALAAEAEVTRRRGHATEDGEYRAQRRAAAAPVFLPHGDPLAALAATTTGGAELGALTAPVVELAAALTHDLEALDD